MKKLILLFLCLCYLKSEAQQDPYYTHFKDVVQSYNPAAAGMNECLLDINALTHAQWRDYSDAPSGTEQMAPFTAVVNVGGQKRIGRMGNDALGFGLTLLRDQNGFTLNKSFYGQVNYRKLYDQGNKEVAGGLSIGGMNFGFNDPKWVARDSMDPLIPLIGQSDFNLNTGIGFTYQQKEWGKVKNFIVGLSASNVNQPQFDLGSSYVYTKQLHLYALASAEYSISSQLQLEPAVLLKMVNTPAGGIQQIDASVRARMHNNFLMGLAYRQFANADAASLLFGYERRLFEVGYSYDFTLSAIQQVSNGTHEVVLKYSIPMCKSEEVDSVRFL